MSMHNNLLGGTRSRLRRMRSYVQGWNTDEKKKARGVRAITWRDARSHGVASIRVESHGPSFSQDGRYANIPECVLSGLRFEFASETETAKNRYARDRCEGWWADVDCDLLYRPAVWRLPSRGGESSWLAGYVERDGVRRDSSPSDSSPSRYCVLSCRAGRFDTFSDERGAVNEAERLAERMAEDAREYDEKWQEASRASDEREEARQEFKSLAMRVCMALQALRDQRAKAGGVADSVCALILRNVREQREEMRQALRVICAKSAEIESLNTQGEF